MAFKIVVLHPSIDERAPVHLNSFGGCQSPYIMMAKTTNHFFNDVKTYNLNYRMAEIYYYTNRYNASV